MKRLISSIIVILITISLFNGCTKKPNEYTSNKTNEITKISFAGATSYSTIKALSGQMVSITGFMATVSPVSGEFLYLLNLPYQSCPFCVPNTSELANTMAVYSKKGKTFEYTNQAIQVTGTLEIGDFTDEFGYQYNYRIIDADYVMVDTSNLSDELKLWQKIASTEVIPNIYSMYDYIYFLCAWNTYKTSDFYLTASDALQLIQTEGAQYNYGYVDGYFDEIIRQIREVSNTEFEDLVNIIIESQELSETALKELTDGNYTYEYKYIDEFKTYDNVFTITKAKELEEGFYDVYYKFADWLAQYEL